MSDKTDLIMEEFRKKMAAKAQSSNNNNSNKQSAQYWGNIGGYIRNEHDEEVFVSLGGIALDSLLKLSSGNSAVTRTRNALVNNIATICQSLEDGDTSLASDYQGVVYKFTLQIRKVGDANIDPNSFADIDLTKIFS